MEEKKLTDEEIVKAMEICANWDSMSNCKDCPIGLDACCENQNGFAKYALDLIRRLQYGYSSASKASEEWKEKYEAERKENAEKKAEIERLTDTLNQYINGELINADTMGKIISLEKQVNELKKWLGMKEHYIAISRDKEKQAVKDTAKEMIEEIGNIKEIFPNDIVGYEQAQGWSMCIDKLKEIAKSKGVEVE